MSFRKGRGGEQAQGDGEGAHGYMVPRLGEKESPTSAFCLFRRLYPQEQTFPAVPP